MRILFKVAAGALALILIVAGLFLLWDWNLTREEKAYYADRKILGAMLRVHDLKTTVDSGPARTELLTHLPPGTRLGDAVASLIKEGFGCAKAPDKKDAHQKELEDRFRAREQLPPRADPPPRTVMDCQILAPAGVGYTRWIVDLSFDDEQRLNGAIVAIWNIFL